MFETQITLWAAILTLIILLVTSVWIPLVNFRNKRRLDKYPFGQICDWRLIRDRIHKGWDTSDLFDKCKSIPFQTTLQPINLVSGENNLWIELSPKIAGEISQLDARFKGDSNSLPEILEIADLAPIFSSNFFDGRDKTNRGRYIIYDEELPKRIFPNKAIDYCICCKAYDDWHGELSLRILMRNREPIIISMRCSINSK
jgi:hypothetical protein